MPGIVFSEGSNLNNSIFGKCQAPIRMFLEKRGEDFEKQSLLPYLFQMGTSENYAEMLTAMTAMNGFEPVGENGAYPNDSMQEGFSKYLQSETWKDSFAISQEMVEDAKVMDMKKQPAAFMQSYGRTREMFGAAIYAGAMAGKKAITYKGKTFDISTADKQAAFSVAHPAAVKGKAQSNMFSDAFSVDALDRAETAMHLFRGDTDEILDVAPDTILIPEDADLKRQVFAAIGADKDPLTANNAFNYQFGRWRVIIWSYLNQFIVPGEKPWILLDSQHNEDVGGAVWMDRIKLEVKSDIDTNTDANLWKGRSRFNATFNDWRFACVGGVKNGTALAG